MMNWEMLSKSDAENALNNYIMDIPTYNLNSFYQELQTDGEYEYKKIQSLAAGENKLYYLDYNFGLFLYGITVKHGMGIREASNDGVWRYLSVVVFPSILEQRHKIDWEQYESDEIYKNQIAQKYYSSRRRNWLKTIWWYIHLTYQNDSTGTKNVLRDYSTDTILNLVDRIGSKGYHVDCTREIIKQFDQKGVTKDRNKLFRMVMIVYLAKLKNFDPIFVKGGPKEFVKSIIDYVF